MKFTYRYRTSDNQEHQGEISAPDREAAFRAIRAQGIKPGQLQAAPGFFNLLFGKGKRWMVIGALVLAVGVSVGLWLRTEKKVETLLRSENASPRHQIYGDPEIMGRMVQCGFRDFLPRLGDCILAQFAQPGKFLSAKGFTENDIVHALAEVKDSDVDIAPEEVREIRELKQIVNGMREEMRVYLSDGMGSYRSYFQRLVERYLAEKEIHDRVETELSRERDEKVWIRKNEELRRLGLAVIVRPERLENLR